MQRSIEIKPKSILLTIAIVAAIWLVIQIRDILGMLFIAFILMSVLRPMVDGLEKIRFPRFLAIIIIYILLIGLMITFGTIILPPLITQSVRLGIHLPQYISQVTPFININFDTVIAQVAPFGENVARVTFGVFSHILTIVTILVFVFYFLLERNNLKKILEIFTGEEVGARVIVVVKKIEERMGAWVRGQLILALVIGVASLIGLTLLGINYALPLALIAGILEMVPIIGPIMSSIPAILVALTVSPGLALTVVALYFVIQQLENHLIVPQVMHRVVGIPPLAILLALMIGGRLGGITGILLSVPSLLVLQTVVQEFIISQSHKS